MKVLSFTPSPAFLASPETTPIRFSKQRKADSYQPTFAGTPAKNTSPLKNLLLTALLSPFLFLSTQAKSLWPQSISNITAIEKNDSLEKVMTVLGLIQKEFPGKKFSIKTIPNASNCAGLYTDNRLVLICQAKSNNCFVFGLPIVNNPNNGSESDDGSSLSAFGDVNEPAFPLFFTCDNVTDLSDVAAEVAKYMKPDLLQRGSLQNALNNGLIGFIKP